MLASPKRVWFTSLELGDVERNVSRRESLRTNTKKRGNEYINFRKKCWRCGLERGHNLKSRTGP